MGLHRYIQYFDPHTVRLNRYDYMQAKTNNLPVVNCEKILDFRTANARMIGKLGVIKGRIHENRPLPN